MPNFVTIQQTVQSLILSHRRRQGRQHSLHVRLYVFITWRRLKIIEDARVAYLNIQSRGVISKTMTSRRTTNHLADIRCRNLPTRKHHFFILTKKITEPDLTDTGNKLCCLPFNNTLWSSCKFLFREVMNIFLTNKYDQLKYYVF